MAPTGVDPQAASWTKKASEDVAKWFESSQNQLTAICVAISVVVALGVLIYCLRRCCAWCCCCCCRRFRCCKCCLCGDTERATDSERTMNRRATDTKFVTSEESEAREDSEDHDSPQHLGKGRADLEAQAGRYAPSARSSDAVASTITRQAKAERPKCLFQEGEIIYYHSGTFDAWIVAQVTKVRLKDGAMEVNVKEKHWFSRPEQALKFRRNRFSADEEIEIFSVVQDAWLEAQVISVREADGAVLTSADRSRWLSPAEQVDICRRPGDDADTRTEGSQGEALPFRVGDQVQMLHEDRGWVDCTVLKVQQGGAVDVDAGWIKRRIATSDVATTIRRYRYDIGEEVQYLSATHGGWIEAEVTQVRPSDGAIELDVKEGCWFTPAAQRDKIRAAASGDCPYQVGDSVLYLSDTNGGWVQSKVTQLRKDGAVQLDLKSGYWFTCEDQKQKLRRCSSEAPEEPLLGPQARAPLAGGGGGAAPAKGAGRRTQEDGSLSDALPRGATKRAPTKEVGLDETVRGGPKKPASGMESGTHQVGDSLLYLSVKNGGWVACKVTQVREDGAVELDVKSGRWFTPEEQAEKLKRPPEMLPEALPEVGERVQYLSPKNGGWVPCKVAQVRQDGAVELDVKAGRWLTVEEQSQHVRRPPEPSQEVRPDDVAIELDLREEEEEEEPAASPAAAEPAAPPAAAATANLYRVGDQVQYHSATNGGWVACKVAQVRKDGRVEIDIKKGTWFSTEEQKQKLRRPPEVVPEEAAAQVARGATVTLLSPLERALALHEDGQLAEAASQYRQVLESQPGHVRAMHCLGAVLLAQGHGEQAEELWREVLDLDSGTDDAETLASLAGLLRDQGEVAAAKAIAEKVSALGGSPVRGPTQALRDDLQRQAGAPRPALLETMCTKEPLEVVMPLPALRTQADALEPPTPRASSKGKVRFG